MWLTWEKIKIENILRDYLPIIDTVELERGALISVVSRAGGSNNNERVRCLTRRHKRMLLKKNKKKNNHLGGWKGEMKVPLYRGKIRNGK